MQDWEKIYMSYVNDSQENLAKRAKEHVVDIYKAFVEKTDDKKGSYMFVVNLFASYIAADKEITRSEWALFNYIFEIEDSEDHEKLEYALNNFRNLTSYDELNTIIDQCEPELKVTIIKLGLCICAIDGRISVPEQEIIARYAN